MQHVFVVTVPCAEAEDGAIIRCYASYADARKFVAPYPAYEVRKVTIR